jgi:hypothetical protein
LSVSTVFIFLAIMWMMSPFVSSAHMKLSTEDAKWLTDYSAPNRPLIPFQIGHPIRSKSAGYSETNQATCLRS